jgi:hypothetical protein
MPRPAFEFIFQLYNFLSAAKADNDSLHEPERRLAYAKDSVARKRYPILTCTKRRCEESEYDSSCSRGSSASETSEGSRDSFDHPELSRAGYTLTRLPKGLTPLTPVSRDARRCAR